MIEKLYLKNYVIIKEAEIEFVEGLNVLTGETGAGKSIIIDALSLVLGERADFSKIKKGEDKLIAEAEIRLTKMNKELSDFLDELMEVGIAEKEVVIIRRELSAKGTSRNFINESLVSLAELKKFGDMIIDIHSQNEHQSLLNKEYHMKLLDDFIADKSLFDGYRSDFNEYRSNVSDYENLVSKKDDYLGKRSFLEYELKEINNLNILPGEDAELEEELKKLENVEEISIAASKALKMIYDDENSSVSTLDSAIKELRKISVYDSSFDKMTDDLENSHILIKEASGLINSYLNKLSFDPERVDQIRTRLSAISRLKKKLGMSTEEISLKAESLERELTVADNFDFEMEKLLKKISDRREKLFETAKKICDLRKRKGKELSKNINEIFGSIGLDNAEFRIEINDEKSEEGNLYSHRGLRIGIDGFNDVEFVIRANKGQDFSPLRKAASGGEISRIMLAIKTALSEKDKIGILVFDEIDSGISGRIAQKVGLLLKKLSQTHQIICITHLPQIAAMSKRHFHVSKEDDKGVTIANIKLLDYEEKVNEVASLISGDRITETARKSAKELIESI